MSSLLDGLVAEVIRVKGSDLHLKADAMPRCLRSFKSSIL